MTKSQQQTVTIVLSGGAGKRVDGADKGLQLYQGRCLIEHVLERVALQSDDIVICANRNIETYRQFGYRVVQDKHVPTAGMQVVEAPIFQGPMAGIAAALTELEGSSFDQALVSSCDVPKLPLDLRKRLEGSLKSVSVAHDGKRKQNLHCLIHREAWASFIEFFNSGGRAMHRWFEQVGCTAVDFSDQADGFLNINSLEQLIGS